jgi:hypothetical protein
MEGMLAFPAPDLDLAPDPPFLITLGTEIMSRIKIRSRSRRKTFATFVTFV